MNTKIGPVDPGAVGKSSSRTGETATDNKLARSPGGQVSDARGTSAREDTVELTGQARLLEQLESSLESVEPIDSTRIAEIRSAIENGEYELDANAIASAFLRFEKLLGD